MTTTKEETKELDIVEMIEGLLDTIEDSTKTTRELIHLINGLDERITAIETVLAEVLE